MFVRGEWKDELQTEGKYLQATHQTKDHLGIRLTKHIEELNARNDNIQMKEIKENLICWKTHHSQDVNSLQINL